MVIMGIDWRVVLDKSRGSRVIQAGFASFDSSALRSLSKWANAASNESLSFQCEKSGMKNWRMTSARSSPELSGNSYSSICLKATSRMGKSFRLPSRFSANLVPKQA